MIKDITIINQQMLENWVKNQDGRFLHLLQSQTKNGDTKSISHKWLLESTPKRMIYEILYGDLLVGNKDKVVVDVGSGYCSLSSLLTIQHQYYPVDFSLSGIDWYNFNCPDCDIVLANDLFPNVDQRLELFLGKFLPHCKEMRLSLTYFNKPKWYTLKRIDGDEILTMLAWTGEQVRDVLEGYNSNMTSKQHVNLSCLTQDVPSISPNGRQVAIVSLKGQN